jgi:DNA repair protein RAD16
MFLLKNKILKSIVLRRTKKGRAADLALPPRIVSFYDIVLPICYIVVSKSAYEALYSFLPVVQVTLRRDSLDIKEEDYYTSLYNESQAQFNTYVPRMFFSHLSLGNEAH